MKYLTYLTIILLFCVVTSEAGLVEGDTLPNPTLTSQDGEEIPLLDLLNEQVTVIHLWKCN
ncbi:MAG: hypothetical protein P9M15_06365 [Candidatus Electryoneaceae bacterium]|nr:hypothetical protein [Candidatus Electryoneaceae bacterium]